MISDIEAIVMRSMEKHSVFFANGDTNPEYEPYRDDKFKEFYIEFDNAETDHEIIESLFSQVEIDSNALLQEMYQQ